MNKRFTKTLAVLLSAAAFAGCTMSQRSTPAAQAPGIEQPATEASPGANGQAPNLMPGQSLEINLDTITIPELQQYVRDGKLTYQEITQRYLDRIDLYDNAPVGLNAVIALSPNAINEAQQADLKVQQNPELAKGLFGLPILVKDNINFDQLPTTAGALALADNIPPYNATVIDTLLDNGAIILGKVNMSEFAGMADDPVESAVGGVTHNPYRPQVLIGDEPWGSNTGGSSSGSAAAAAAAFAPITIGTETKGSLLNPASQSQVVTIKPTTGLISRWGIIPVQFSQDTPGPMARNVTDLAIALTAMTSGVDPHDAKTAALTGAGVIGTDYTQNLRLDGLQGKRIGLLNVEEIWPLEPGASANLDKVIAVLEGAGAIIVRAEDGGYLEYPTGAGFQEYVGYEFKKGLNEYLATLNPSFPIKSLSDVIAFNESHPAALVRGTQFGLIQADEVDLESESPHMQTLIAETQQLLGPDGIDALLQQYQLDALLDIDVTDYGAIAGYPSSSVPLYQDNDNPSRSINVIFTGPKFSESLLIELAYVVEQGTQFRVAPGLADKTELTQILTAIVDTQQEKVTAAMEANPYLTEGQALRQIFASDPALVEFLPALDTYFNGLATQDEVEIAVESLRSK